MVYTQMSFQWNMDCQSVTRYRTYWIIYASVVNFYGLGGMEQEL